MWAGGWCWRSAGAVVVVEAGDVVVVDGGNGAVMVVNLICVTLFVRGVGAWCAWSGRGVDVRSASLVGQLR